MDHVVEAVADTRVPAAADRSALVDPPSDVGTVEQDEVRDLRASAACYAEVLKEAVQRDAEQLRAAARHEAEVVRFAAEREAEAVRAASSLEADRARAETARKAEEVRAEAQLAAERCATAGAREAGAMVVRAARCAAEALELAAAEEERLTRATTAAVVEVRAHAEAEAARVLAEAAAERTSALESRRDVEAAVAKAAAVASAAARSLLDEAEGHLAATLAEEALADRAAAEILVAAHRRNAAVLDAAGRDLQCASMLLAEAREGGMPTPDLEPPVSAGESPAPATSAPGAVPPVLVSRSVVATKVDAAVETAIPRAPPAKVADAGGPPRLVPALSLGRELGLRLLVWCSLAAAGFFWVWWIGRGHGSWSPASAVVTGLLAWIFILPFYFYFFACRMSRPNPMLPVPDLRVGMVVTKAPSEPWLVVRRTLRAMLAQEIPLPYDVWLADERPTEEVERWCAENGVQISTRHGVAEYHRAEWPRRTRSKEGNLAFFYDRFGYELYDVVAQLDADHVPGPDYLEEMVRPFGDPRVGYVCAPSVCDANTDAGWTVRGRLYREATMHGPVQAGCNGGYGRGYGPVCIGSHYAVRTAALRAVGGVGPELAEDYSTTLWLQSAGWEGVFNIAAEAHGDGPESLDEMLRQEVQWARSLGTILVRWAPGRLRRVPWRARVRLGFALAFYPLQGFALAVAAVLPVVGVLLHASWGDTSIIGFYVHLWPFTLLGLLTVGYLRWCRLLRPPKAKLWSWELVLFQLVRWPWTFGGFLLGACAGWRSKVVGFTVTAKADPGVKPLRPRSVVPTLALGVLPALVVVLVRHPGPALGMQVLAGFEAVSYLSCAVAVVALHLLGNRRRTRLHPGSTLTWPSGGSALALTAAVVVSTVTAIAWRLQAYGLTP